MIYLYQASNKDAGIVKIGLTRTTKTGDARIKDYARKHNLPTAGWSKTRHYKLNTAHFNTARVVEKKVHQAHVTRNKTFKSPRTGRPVREAFRGTSSGAHWTCLSILKLCGLY